MSQISDNNKDDYTRGLDDGYGVGYDEAMEKYINLIICPKCEAELHASQIARTGRATSTKANPKFSKVDFKSYQKGFYKGVKFVEQANSKAEPMHCADCIHSTKKNKDMPCCECLKTDNPSLYFKPKGKAEPKTCETCRHFNPNREDRCDYNCMMKNSYSNYNLWQPKEKK